MKEQLSALIDDELSEIEERRMLEALGADAGLRATWGRYHLMRAALRGELETVASPGLAERVTRVLAAERTDARPPAWCPLARSAAGLALAAGVAAVTLVGMQWLRPAPPQAAQVASARAAAPAPGGARWNNAQPEAERMLDGYLVEHNEFAASGVGGMLPYVRVVGYGTEQ
jgi:sigma-E factor negative regulatory protein RseA